MNAKSAFNFPHTRHVERLDDHMLDNSSAANLGHNLSSFSNGKSYAMYNNTHEMKIYRDILLSLRLVYSYCILLESNSVTHKPFKILRKRSMIIC